MTPEGGAGARRAFRVLRRERLWRRWLVPLAFAGLVAYLLRPGWYFFDGERYWGTAGTLLAKGPRADLSTLGISAGWPLLPALVRMPFVALGPAAFVAAQAGLLFTGLAALADRLSRGRPESAWLLTTGVLALPVTWNYAVFHSADTLVLAATAWMLAAAAAPVRTHATEVRTIVWAGVIGALRFNGLTVTLAMAAWAVGLSWRHARRRGVAAATLATLVLLAGLHAWTRTGKTRNPAREGAAIRLWELRRSSSSPALEAAFVAADVPRDTWDRPLDETCLAAGIWCRSVPLQRLAGVERPRPDVVRLYLQEFLRQPAAWLHINARVAALYLGLSRPLPETEVARDKRPNNLPEYAMVVPEVRDAARAALTACEGAAGGLLARPLWMVLLSLGLLALPGAPRRVAAPLALFGASYLLPWVLVTPSPDFRYVVPVTVPAALVALACLIGFGARLGRRFMGSRAAP